MARTVDNSTKEFKRLEKKVVDLAAAFAKSTKSTKKMGKALAGTDKEVRKGITGVSHLRNQVKGSAGDADKGTTAFTKYQRALSVFRSRLLVVSFGFGLLAKTMGAAFKAAAEQQQAEIKLSTALGRTSKE